MDPLQEIFKDNYEFLMDLLKKDFPESLTVFGWLKTRLSWTGEQPFHVLSPNGILENGIVIFGPIAGTTSLITIYASNNDFTELDKALRTTRKIKWEEVKCVGINMAHAEEMLEILNSFGFNMHNDVTSKVWLMDLEDALNLKIECPEDLYIAELRPEHIPRVNSLWALKYEGSEEYLKELIRLNNSVGLYRKNTDELISWSIECDYSEIGVLYTLPEYRNKGYAQLVIKSLSKQLAKAKQLVLTYNVLKNTAPEKLFRNIGFKHLGHYAFLEYEKKI